MHNCLRNLAFVEYGKSPNEVRDQNGIYPIYGTGGLVGRSNRFLFDQNAIVVARKGTLDNPTYVEGKYWIIDTAYATIPRDNIDAKWLYYCLSDYDLKKLNEATGVPSINRDYLYKIEFYTPTLPKQKQIAKILTTVDNLIEQTQALIDKYTAIKQGMVADLFTRGIDLSGTPETNPNHGQLRPSFEEAPELYKETELGWVPREWGVVQWKKLVTYNCYGPRFSAANYSNNGNVRTIRGTDFSKDGEILYDQVPYALLRQDVVRQHELRNDDVIVVTTADCGLTAVFCAQKDKYIPSAYTVKFRFDETIFPKFVKLFMSTYSAVRQTNSYIRQGTLGNLPGSDLMNYWIQLPSPTEQSQIIHKLESITSKIRKEKSLIEKYFDIKKGLMQDLLTGKVQVTT